MFDYDGGEVQAGHHVTEVMAGSFVALECGGNPDAWQETMLQVEGIPAREGRSQMRVGEFVSILARVDQKVRLKSDARLTIEASRPDVAMRVFHVAGLALVGERAVLRLGAWPAICKPRHRAQSAEAAACCSPVTTKGGASACCA